MNKSQNYFVRVIFFSLVSFASICCAEDGPIWQNRLDVSLNGDVPHDLPAGFQNKFWSSLSLRLNMEKEEFSFDLTELRRRKLFKTNSGEKLKHAILSADTSLIAKLIEEGANVNEKGTGNVTPLYLAMFVDTDPRPFELLIKNGADPNVPCDIDCRPLLGLHSTVSHLASMPRYNRLFELTFRNSGKPNLPAGVLGPPFAFAAFDQPDAVERQKLLAGLGTDFNQPITFPCDRYLPSLLLAGLWEENEQVRNKYYQLSMSAIGHGADYRRTSFPGRYRGKKTDFSDCHFLPIHYVVLAAKKHDKLLHTPDASALLDFLQSKGQSFDEAVEDLKRWKRWKEKGFDKLIDIEHEKIKSDTSGVAVRTWREKELGKIISELEKEAEENWNNPIWRIQRLPTTTFDDPNNPNGQFQVFRGQDVVWSDIVQSGLLHKYLIEKWEEVTIFEDPKVEALKVAMFDRDLAEMKRLIKTEKVNVNSIGREKLTLLYLSLGIDDDPRPFELLLNSGANPNITNDAPHEQQRLAVVHVIAKSKYCRHFKTVFEQGGDANLVTMGKNPIGYIPIDCRDWNGRVNFLCQRGARINQANQSIPIVETLMMDWLKGSKQRRARHIVTALQQGASVDFEVPYFLSAPQFAVKGQTQKHTVCRVRLPHLLLECEINPQGQFPQLATLLEARGESIEEAEKDLARWRGWLAEGRPELIEQQRENRLLNK